MNLKSTFALLILAAAAGFWLWKGDELVPRLAPKGAPADTPTVTALETDFTPEKITRIEITPPGGDPFVFVREGDSWSQPGSWPLRTVEVNELVQALGTLRTRFQPVPAEGDLKAFGLAESQKPLSVKVTAGGKEYALKFGEPELKPGEAPFTRPAYVQVNGTSELLKLGPDVMPVLRRPADSYRRRQLFPEVERVKFAGAPRFTQPGAPPEPPVPETVALPSGKIEEVRVGGEPATFFGHAVWPESPAFTLRRTGPTPAPAVTERNAEATVQPDRLADAWEVSSPRRDRPDPAALRRVLAAVPELWVEKFLPAKEVGFAVDHPYSVAQMIPIPLEPLPATLMRLQPNAAILAPLAEKVPPEKRTLLDQSKQSVTVAAGGRPVTVKFGGYTFAQREEAEPTQPPVPDVAPRTETRTVTTAYRYAQVEGNPQVFTVPADALSPLFVKAGELVDARVARFKADEVESVVILRPGEPPITLMRRKGNPKAEKDEEKRDRWLIGRNPNPLPADSERVEEFVSRLADFRGDPSATLYRADPKERGLDPAKCVTVTVVTREKRPPGEPAAPAREYEIRVGSPDFAAGKLPVQLAGWPRVTLLDDRVPGTPDTSWLGSVLFPERLEPLFRRDAIAYRSRKLLDTADAKPTGLTIEGEKGFALKQEKQPGGAEEWKLTAPIASDTNPQTVGPLLSQVGDLQATEFLTEKPANLAEYGLDKPKLTAKIAFGDGRNYRLEVGGPRPGKKDEVFARLDGGAVFTLPVTATDSLAAGPMGLLPSKVWSVPLDRITSAEVTRLDKPEESFTLTRDGTNWKLAGPFAAPVPFLNAQVMLTQLANLSAAKYEALSATDAAKYGLDKPLAKVKLTFLEKSADGERPVTKAVVIGGAAPGAFDHFARLDDDKAPVFVLPPDYLFAAQTPPLSLPDRNLLSLDPARITKIQISGEKPESAVTLAKGEKGEWKAEGATFAVDSLVAAEVAEAFAPLTVERLAAYGDAVKWGEFGLEKPEYTVTVTLGGEKPTTHTLQIGKAEPTGGRFVRVDSGKVVGVIPPDAVATLARTRLDFADRTLFTFKPEELLGVVRTKGKEELELAPGAGDSWDVVKPAKLKADKPLVEELADALGRLRAVKVAAVGKKGEVLKEYGLDPPEATLTLTVGEKLDQKVLRIGKPVDGAKPKGDRYASVESGGAEATVGILPAALVNKLLAPPVSFRDRTIAKFVDADQLQLERGARSVTFAKQAGTWKVTKPLSADAEQSALDDLVNELAKLRAADWVAENPTPEQLKSFGLDKPEATWTVKYGDRTELALRVGKKAEDGRVYATAGTGGPVAVLGPAQTAKVLAEYRVRKPWTLDAFQVQTVQIEREGNNLTLAKEGVKWVDPAAPDQPVEQKAVTDLLGTLAGLQVERFAVDAGADLKLFGLEKPEATVSVTLQDGGTRTLAVGGVVGGTGDKQRYARVADKDRTDVFVLSAADTDRLMRGRSVYVQKK